MTGLPEPRANPLLLGQAAAEASLLDAMQGDRLHHAWLLLGPPGIGKATLAFRFARFLLAGRPPTGTSLYLPPSHPTFRRVAASGHADLLTIERGYDEKRKKERAEIVVDDVHAVTGFLHLTPAEGGWRVVIVDGAEHLNRSAGNALLKILEEPPPRAILLLACSAAGRLLPTLRSRCRKLRLAPLPDTDVMTLLAEGRPDTPAAEQARLAGLAAGSIGRAIDLADADGVALAAIAARSLGRMAHLTTGDALAAADAVGREDAAFDTFMSMLRDGLSGRVRDAARRGAREFGGQPLGACVAVWSALGRIQGATLGLHLDKREALVQGFAMLAGQQHPDTI